MYPARWIASSAWARFSTPSQLLSSFESAVDTIIRLMAVFLFKTVALPLLFLYVLMRFFNRVWQADFRLATAAQPGPESRAAAKGITLPTPVDGRMKRF